MSYLLFQSYSSICIADRLYTQPLHGVSVRTNAFCYAKHYYFADTDQTTDRHVDNKVSTRSKIY